MNYETAIVAWRLLCPWRSCQPLYFIGCNVFSLSTSALAHAHCQLTASQGWSVWGPKTLSRYPETNFFLFTHTHKQRTVFVHINKKHTRDVLQMHASGLFTLLSCFFPPISIVKNSLAVMSIWWNHIVKFQGVYTKWITLPSSSPNTFCTC